MPLQLRGSLTVTFWVAGPMVTVVMPAKPWVSPENGATRRTFGVLPSPPGSQEKAIQSYWALAQETAADFLAFWICMSSSSKGGALLRAGGCQPRLDRLARVPW